MKIYFDSCIVIYLVENHPEYASKVERRISELSGNDTLCSSPLVHLECLVTPFRTRDASLIGNFKSFFETQEMLEMSAEVFEKAARLRADYHSLKTPDAIHLAAASHFDCHEFWTNDDRLHSVIPILVKNVLSK